MAKKKGKQEAHDSGMESLEDQQKSKYDTYEEKVDKASHEGTHEEGNNNYVSDTTSFENHEEQSDGFAEDDITDDEADAFLDDADELDDGEPVEPLAEEDVSPEKMYRILGKHGAIIDSIHYKIGDEVKLREHRAHIMMKHGVQLEEIETA